MDNPTNNKKEDLAIPYSVRLFRRQALSTYLGMRPAKQPLSLIASRNIILLWICAIVSIAITLRLWTIDVPSEGSGIAIASPIVNSDSTASQYFFLIVSPGQVSALRPGTKVNLTISSSVQKQVSIVRILSTSTHSQCLVNQFMKPELAGRIADPSALLLGVVRVQDIRLDPRGFYEVTFSGHEQVLRLNIDDKGSIPTSERNPC